MTASGAALAPSPGIPGPDQRAATDAPPTRPRVGAEGTKQWAQRGLPNKLGAQARPTVAVCGPSQGGLLLGHPKGMGR